jgi:hypothetical protein
VTSHLRAFQSAAVAVWALLTLPSTATAQQPTPPPQAPAPQAFQYSAEWEKLPRMQLQRQFAGPLQDTVIQRLVDPVDGTVCYLYLPISAPHSPPTNSGFVEYGASNIGTINCFAGPNKKG